MSLSTVAGQSPLTHENTNTNENKVTEKITDLDKELQSCTQGIFSEISSNAESSECERKLSKDLNIESSSLKVENTEQNTLAETDLEDDDELPSLEESIKLSLKNVKTICEKIKEDDTTESQAKTELFKRAKKFESALGSLKETVKLSSIMEVRLKEIGEEVRNAPNVSRIRNRAFEYSVTTSIMNTAKNMIPNLIDDAAQCESAFNEQLTTYEQAMEKNPSCSTESETKLAKETTTEKNKPKKEDPQLLETNSHKSELGDDDWELGDDDVFREKFQSFKESMLQEYETQPKDTSDKR